MSCVCASLEANKSPIQSSDTIADRLLQEAANPSFRLSVRTPLSNIIKYDQMIVCFVLVRVGPSYSGEFGRPAVLSMCIHFHPLMQTWRSWNPHFTVPESLRNLFEFRASWFALPCFKQPAVRHQELYMPGHFCHHVEWRSSYTSSVINIHPHGCQCQTLSNPQSAINAWFLE